MFKFKLNVLSKGLVFSTSGWSTTTRALFQIFFYQISRIFVDLFAKNMKGWSDNSKLWHVQQSDRAVKKNQKTKNYPGSLCANISQKIIFGSSKIFADVYSSYCSTGPLTSTFTWGQQHSGSGSWQPQYRLASSISWKISDCNQSQTSSPRGISTSRNIQTSSGSLGTSSILFNYIFANSVPSQRG